MNTKIEDDSVTILIACLVGNRMTRILLGNEQQRQNALRDQRQLGDAP